MRSVRLLRHALALAVLLCVVDVGAGRSQQFQWPDEPENLEVLPDDIGADGLRRTMTGFTDALGVRCSHCHVGEGNDLTEYDFAADDREEKRAARVMMRMVREINDTHLPKAHELLHDHAEGHSEGGEAPGVTCVTCHRGAERPRMIEDLLAGTIRAEGVEAAAERYRTLRERYYGGFTYDFRVGPLSELSQRLTMEGRTDAAVRVAELEVEYHPDSFRAHFALGRALARADRRQEAVAEMERALELAPERVKPFVERQLQQLRGGGDDR